MAGLEEPSRCARHSSGRPANPGFPSQPSDPLLGIDTNLGDSLPKWQTQPRRPLQPQHLTNTGGTYTAENCRRVRQERRWVLDRVVSSASGTATQERACSVHTQPDLGVSCQQEAELAEKE